MSGNVSLWSTTDVTNESADPAINFAEGQLPGTVNNSARAVMSGVAAWRDDINGTLTTSGSANVQTVTTNTAYAALATGIVIGFKAGFANTGPATLTVTGASAFAAKAIRYASNTGGDRSLLPGMIALAGHYLVRYDAAADSAAGAWMLLNPSKTVDQPSAGGRLTLVTATPVMVSTQSAKTVIYYAPYLHNRISINDASGQLVATPFSELSNDTTASATGKAGPAAVTTNSNYDLFVWDDAGTVRLTRGPLWTSAIGRGTGAGTTELDRSSNGILVNKVAITNGPGALLGTYVGTVRSNGSSQIDWIVPTGSGTAISLGVWNNYNRVNVNAWCSESTGSWAYTSSTVRAANGSTVVRASFLVGMAEDYPQAQYSVAIQPAAVNAAFGIIGIGILDSTVAFATAALNEPLGTFAMIGTMATAFSPLPSLGWHFIAALEQGDNTNSFTYYGSPYGNFNFSLRM